MKNLAFFLAVVGIIAFTNCNENKSDKSDQKAETQNLQAANNTQTDGINKNSRQPGEIKTNYHDLPDNQQEVFSKTLALGEDKKWTASTIDILKEFADIYLLAKENPGTGGISSNYFWYVYNALPDFVSPQERHQGYYINNNKQDFEDKLKAYGIYRIDRSSENLKTLFEFGKPIMKELISPQEYKDLGAESKVNQLIKMYDMMKEKEDYEQLLKNAYIHADTATGTWVQYGEEPVFETYNAAYGLDAYKLSEIICGYFEYDRYHPYYGHPELSFWMRRVHEGNAETVYELLNNIRSIYK